MDLKINTPVDNAGVPRNDAAPIVFIAIVEQEAKLPVQGWATVRPLTAFIDLVKGQASVDDVPLVIAVPDVDADLAKVRLVCDNAGTIGVRVVQVKGLTAYLPSPRALTAFWGADFITWEDWMIDAEEATRLGNIAKMDALDSDEKRLATSQRSDGTVKAFQKAGVGAPDADADDLGMDKVSF